MDIDEAEVHLARLLGHEVKDDLGILDQRLVERYHSATTVNGAASVDDGVVREAKRVAPTMLPSVVEWGSGTNHKTLNRDGTGDGPWLGGLRPPRKVMGGGERVKVHRLPFVGERLFTTERLESIEKKTGRTGEFLVLEFEIEFRTTPSEKLLTNRRTIIIR